MTVDGVTVPGATGHSYNVAVSADAFKVTAVSADDEPGLKGAEEDVQSLRPLFFSQPPCPIESQTLCPALAAFVGRVGIVAGTRTEELPAKFSLKGTPAAAEESVRAARSSSLTDGHGS